MSRIVFGVIGYGEAGKAYASAIEAASDTSVAATCGPFGSAERYLHFEDADGVLARGDVNALVYAGPPSGLVHVVDKAAERALPVLIAGPPGVTAEDLETLQKLHESAQGQPFLFFTSPFFFHSSVGRALVLANPSNMGRVLSVRGVYGYSHRNGEDSAWRNDPAHAGGGVLLHEGYEMIRLIEAFGGDVQSTVGRVTADAPDDDGGGLDTDAAAVLSLQSGALAQLHVSSRQWRHMFRMEAMFEGGYVWLDGLQSKRGDFAPEVLISAKVRREADGTPSPNPAEEVRTFEDDAAAARALSMFLSVLDGGAVPPYASFEAAARALRVVHAIQGDSA